MHLHPGLAVHINVLRRAEGTGAVGVEVLEAVLVRAAVALGLRVVPPVQAAEGDGVASGASAGSGRVLWLAQGADCSPAVREAVAGAAAHARALWLDGHGPRPPGQGAFRPAEAAGAHAVRVAARWVALRLARPSRQDYEELLSADLGALAAPAWKRWKRSLSTQDRGLLAMWRGGGAPSPTRRWHACPSRQACRCGACWASARHLWAECPLLGRHRRRLELAWGLPSAFWAAAPRCVAKSGWTVWEEELEVGARAARLVAANQLGVEVIRHCIALLEPAP